MRHIFSAAILVTALITGAMSAAAQKQPPPAAPPKPYKALAITPPMPVADPSFDAFRKQLGEVAQKKDRAALARLVVAQGFFWERENGDRADKRKPGSRKSGERAEPEQQGCRRLGNSVQLYR